MKDRFHTRGFQTLIALIFVMLAVMLFTAGRGNNLLANAFGFVSTPMQKVSTVATNNAKKAIEPATASKEELLARIAELEKENEDLNTRLAEYNSLKVENAQLRKYLELKNENQDFKPVPAAVIGRGTSELFGGFTIDKGSLDGISVGDPVVTEAGLVGKISEVRATHSRVVTILSPDNNVAALVSESRDIGVVESDIKLADQGLVRLSYLSADTSVKEGDLVVTSGMAGVYPGSQKIGRVTAVKHSETDVSLYAEVRPFVDVNTVRDVMVITEFKGQGESLDDLGGDSLNVGGDSSSGSPSSGSASSGSGSSQLPGASLPPASGASGASGGEASSKGGNGE